MRTNAIDPVALRLAAVVASSDDAIISQAMDGTIETWNRAAERMFGYTSAEAIGRPIDLIVPPECRPDEREILARLTAGESVSHFESVGLAKDGTRVPISVALAFVVTPQGETVGISRIARDITEQRALEREAFRLAAIVDSSEDAIVSKNLDGIVQTWNRAAERLFGYTAEEIVGRSIRLIIPPDRFPEEDDVLARIRAGTKVDHFETIRRRKDGTLIEISLSVSPIRTPQGLVIGASKIARDISLQRRLAREAEDANRVKDEFLAMLSHELRTPLNAVMGYTRMLRTGLFGEVGQDRVVDIIERNANVLSQLVSDVLDVSSIVTGKVRLNAADCDLRQVLDAAVDVVRPSAHAKGIALQLVMPGSPVPARCDADRMQQVLWNLLSNAVKYTSRGGHIDVRLVAADDTAEITVADSGIGIRREALPHVFQRFWQGETEMGLHAGGLGLGLALARHFVELHGGSIAATSAGEGQGATFIVSLPLGGGR